MVDENGLSTGQKVGLGVAGVGGGLLGLWALGNAMGKKGAGVDRIYTYTLSPIDRDTQDSDDRLFSGKTSLSMVLNTPVYALPTLYHPLKRYNLTISGDEKTATVKQNPTVPNKFLYRGEILLDDVESIPKFKDSIHTFVDFAPIYVPVFSKSLKITEDVKIKPTEGTSLEATRENNFNEWDSFDEWRGGVTRHFLFLDFDDGGLVGNISRYNNRESVQDIQEKCMMNVVPKLDGEPVSKVARQMRENKEGNLLMRILVRKDDKIFMVWDYPTQLLSLEEEEITIPLPETSDLYDNFDEVKVDIELTILPFESDVTEEDLEGVSGEDWPDIYNFEDRKLYKITGSDYSKNFEVDFTDGEKFEESLRDNNILQDIAPNWDEAYETLVM